MFGKKIIAGTLCFFIFLTHAVFAYSIETNLWNERRKTVQLASIMPGLPSAINPLHSRSAAPVSSIPKWIDKEPASLRNLAKNLPYNLGTIREIRHPKQGQSGKTIVLVQDIHRNLEAQQNISALITHLSEQKTIQFIGLEGDHGRFDLEKLRNDIRQDARESVADYLLEAHKISGAIHSALTAPNIPAYITGIEDAVLYSENVIAYQKAAPLMADANEQITAYQSELVQKSRRLLNPQLAAFDAIVRRYDEKQLKLYSYFQILRGHGELPPSLLKLLNAIRMEESIDYQQVESERAQFLNLLSARLTAQETSELIEKGLHYRLTSLRSADFYGHLSRLALRKEIPIANFPSLRHYIDYLTLADQIEGLSIIEEIKNLEEKYYQHLIRTPEEQSLIDQLKRIRHQKKLITFSLTAKEWDEYKVLDHSPSSIDHRPNLSPFERFYGLAHQRDAALASNLIKCAQDDASSVGLVVAGGFHSEGLISRLNGAGFSVISFVPKLTKISEEDGSGYLSEFAQEKTPLEKLVAGEKLFLNPSSRPGVALVRPLEVPVEKGRALDFSQSKENSVSVPLDTRQGMVNYTVKLKANQTDPRKSPKIVSITSRAFLNLKLLLRSIPTLIRLQLALLISAYFLHWLLQSVAEFSSLLPLMAVFINPKLRVESLETRDMMSQTPIGEPILPMDATKSIDALFADQNVVFNPAANAAPSNDALDEYFQELAGEPFVKKDGIDFNFEPELGEYSGLAINSGTDELFITDSDANAVIRATAEGLLLSKIDVSGLKNPAAP